MHATSVLKYYEARGPMKVNLPMGEQIRRLLLENQSLRNSLSGFDEKRDDEDDESDTIKISEPTSPPIGKVDHIRVMIEKTLSGLIEDGSLKGRSSNHKGDGPPKLCGGVGSIGSDWSNPTQEKVCPYCYCWQQLELAEKNYECHIAMWQTANDHLDDLLVAGRGSEEAQIEYQIQTRAAKYCLDKMDSAMKRMSWMRENIRNSRCSNHKGDGPFGFFATELLKWCQDALEKDLTVRATRKQLHEKAMKFKCDDEKNVDYVEIPSSDYLKVFQFLVSARSPVNNDAMLACTLGITEILKECEKAIKLAEARVAAVH